MKQITVGQYLKLSLADRLPYNLLLTSLKKKEWLKLDLNELTYNDVKLLFKKISSAGEDSDAISIFTMAFKIPEAELLEMPIQKYFQTKRYLSDYFVFLKKREYELLQSVSADSALWEMAGGNELEEFSDALPLSQLAKIYGGYPFEWGDKKYVEIIYLLRLNNKQNKVESEYQRLKSKQR